MRTQYVAGLGGGARSVPCPATKRCSACRGLGFPPCAKCGGRGVVLGQCAVCSGTGEEKCQRCEGDGKVGEIEAIPVPEPPPPQGAEGSTLARLDQLRGALRSLDSCTARVDGLRARLDELSGLFNTVKIKVEILGDVGKLPVPLRPSAEVCQEKWRLCQGSYERSGTFLRKLADLRTLADESTPKLRDRIRVLEADPDSGQAPEESFQALVNQASAYTGALDDADTELSRLSRRLQTCEKEAAAFEANRQEHEDALQKKRKRGEAASMSLRSIEALLAVLEEHLCLPDLQAAIDDSSSPLSLQVSVRYLDNAAAEAAGASVEPMPTEALLEKLPSLVTQVFDQSPEVVKVRIRAEALCLGETGLEERRAIQTFTMDRPRWSELTRGKFKDDWRLLLSKSRPAPEYPRPASVASTGVWPIAALLGLCVFGLAVIYVARSRMLSA